MRSLYLDTARLGQMSPGAVNALTDFVRLTAEEPSGLYFEKFLQHGIDALPASHRCRFPGLRCWGGIADLKQSLLRLAGLQSDGRVLLAGRSAQLMELAAISLFRKCRRVLTTDLSWPAYQNTLRREAIRTGGTVEVIPLRRSLLFDGMSAIQLVSVLKREFAQRGCDGLFLPAVDNLGVRLPVTSIVRSIRAESHLGFVAVDGAQAIGHVPLEPGDCYDILVAGCHKWIRGYLPMGLAFYNARSQRSIDQVLRSTIPSRRIDDPLLKLVCQIENGDTDGYSETTNISPLFSCAGALTDLSPERMTVSHCSCARAANAIRVLESVVRTKWRSIQPQESLRSGVVLLQSTQRSVRRAEPERIRKAFRELGTSLSNYEDGVVRISMPDIPLSPSRIAQLRRGLATVK